MANQQISVLERTVRINSLDIPYPEVADFLLRFPEEERLATFLSAIQVGVFSLERAQTSRDTEFVRRQVELLLAGVTSAVEKIPLATQDALIAKIGTANGQVLAPIQNLVSSVTAATATRLQEVKDLLSQDIDPNKESSTIGRVLRALRDLLDAKRSDSVQGSIQTALSQIAAADGALARTVKGTLLDVLQPIQQQLNDLSAEVRSKEAVAEALSHTTLKGFSYEEEVLQELQAWARSTGAQVQHVGIDNQAGDIIVQLPEDSIISQPLSIIVEVRDRQNAAGRKVTNDALSKAMEVRQAGAAIYLSRTTSGLAREMGEWGEGMSDRGPWIACTGPQLLTALRFLIVQVRLARQRAHCADIDSQSIEVQLQRVRTSLERVKKISRRVGEVRTGADEIQEEAESLRDEIKWALAAIEDAIRNPTRSSSCALVPPIEAIDANTSAGSSLESPA
jgi:hypothetical protein